MNACMKPLNLPAIRRMPNYLRVLNILAGRGRDFVSATHIARELHLEPIVVRKDLASTGIVGRPRVGFDVHDLIVAIMRVLGWDNIQDAVLVGAGRLGMALANYPGFRLHGMRIAAVFDDDPQKVGCSLRMHRVFGIERLEELIGRLHVTLGIVTVPAVAAQETATRMVNAGIRCIWNFAPVRLELPDGVLVQNEDLGASLAVLSVRLRQMMPPQVQREECA